MLIPEYLSPLVDLVGKVVPKSLRIKLQENLVRTGIYVRAVEIITLLLLLCISFGLFGILIALVFGIDILISFLVAFSFPLITFFVYLFIMMDRRIDAIEQGTPDFLRQIASLLRAGVGLETALEDVSRQGKGPLYDELRRAVIEIKIGRTFDDALLSMGRRLKSETLDRTFRMIIEGKRAGGSLADVIEAVAEDTRAVLALKRERKANVMMSVMFLVVAAIIAAPFALGMIMVYSKFIESLGKANPILETAKIAAGGYIIIHSIIAGLLIGIVMYGSARKGIKYAIPLAVLAFGIFYVIDKFGFVIVGSMAP
ncbi:conserved hypothetical protein [Methanothermobacter sp. MT-2]|nr:conserved hypothetical protein [Methanothermobacter sp. MT-2]HOK73149.1 type II secretion system F family protein [Methanothermobacter sp.]HPU36738.1 type II secretion system F family protein [Methanothermobacter sp.]